MSICPNTGERRVFEPAARPTIMVGTVGHHAYGRSGSLMGMLMALDLQQKLGFDLVLHDVETLRPRRDTYSHVYYDEWQKLKEPLWDGLFERKKPDWKKTVLERQGKQNNGVPSNLLMQLMGRVE